MKAYFNSDIEEQDIEGLAKAWLTAKPNEHPFFSWLLKARHTPYPLPPLNSADVYVQVFKQRLCNQLNLYLNSRNGSIENAHRVISWLQELHTKISAGLDNQMPTTIKKGKKAVSEQAIRDYITAVTAILEPVEKELAKWAYAFTQDILRQENSLNIGNNSNQDVRPANPFQVSNASSPLNNPFAIFPDASALLLENNPFKNPAEINNHPTGTPVEEKQSFTRLALDKQIRAAYQALVDAGKASINRSVIQKTDGSDEIENTYLGVVRPELKNTTTPSPYFERIRARLGWWAVIDKVHGNIAIKIVALPNIWDATEDIPTNSVFPVQRVADFYARLLEICTEEVRSLHLKFNDRQFFQSAQDKKNFLSQAGTTCINYDQKLVAYDRQRSIEKTAQSFGYLLYKPMETQVAVNFREIAFDRLVSAHSKDIHWNNHRIVALQILTNLPLWRIDMLRGAQPRYHSAIFHHLYAQENNALQYEHRAQNEINLNVLFGPRTCMLLADSELVRQFFRAYLAGLIQLTFDNNGLQARNDWAIVAIPMLGVAEPTLYPPFFLNVETQVLLGYGRH